VRMLSIWTSKGSKLMARNVLFSDLVPQLPQQYARDNKRAASFALDSDAQDTLPVMGL
jgi:hypothetical protein